MDKTPPMTLPLRRTPKAPGDHEIINPALRAWLLAPKGSAACQMK